MSENSLKIRSKFINKISNKLTKLNEDLELLAKVDRKIFRNKRIQSGGTDVTINETQTEAIKKLLEIRQAQKEIDDVTKKVTNLTSQITQINDALLSIKTTVEQIKIKVPEELSTAGFDVNSLSSDVVDSLIANGATLKWSDIKDQKKSGLADEAAFNALKKVLGLQVDEVIAAPAEITTTTVAPTTVLPEATAAEEKFDEPAGERKYRFW